ncbi:MAG: rRNA pseudouridine synthase [Steroidobacteraceae bacterium]|nr:rRNA pseudouridine synthase [Steroidobacteraceae bacterium]
MRDPRFPDWRPAAAPRKSGARLEKVLAEAGVASRRDCEFAIRAGRVRVNSRTVHALPCLVDPVHDLIEYDGAVVDAARRTPGRERGRLYLMLNKPRGVISTARDPGGRPNVVAMVQPAVPPGERVFPVGRLDADSTGLVLLTNDGELAHRLAHPSHGAAKEYRVAVQGALPPESLERLSRGMFLADKGAPQGGAKRAKLERLRVLRHTRDRRRGDLSLVSVTLHEGQNREIRRLFARVGARVKSLERVAIGPLKLGALRSGHFRALRPDEVLALRRSVRLG